MPQLQKLEDGGKDVLTSHLHGGRESVVPTKYYWVDQIVGDTVK